MLIQKIIIIYCRMMTFKKSHILRLTYNGKLLVNVVDNLIIVHHKHAKVYFLVFKCLLFFLSLYFILII